MEISTQISVQDVQKLTGRIEIRLGRKVPATGQVRDIAVPVEPTPNPKILQRFPTKSVQPKGRATACLRWGNMGTQRQRTVGVCQWGVCAHLTHPGKRSDGGRGNRTTATGTPGSLGVVTVSRLNARQLVNSRNSVR